MSTAAVSTNSIYQQLQSYFQARSGDLQKLGQALQAGDVTAAAQEFSAIQTLGQSGPFANGEPFKMSQREQDFAAIGQALQSGDLAGAQQAFAQLKSAFLSRPSQSHPSDAPTPAAVVNLSGASPADAAATASQPTAADSSASNGGAEIVLNLGNVTPGEQITIGLSNAGNGAEQVTIGVAQTNQSPEQITLNLNQNSNQQIVLNLFNSASSGAAQSGLSVTA
jgi:hypothetical protein